MEESIRKADILIEALPYLQEFRGKIIVAKYGGSAIDHPTAMRGILQDLVFLSMVGIHPVLVHGGGPAITAQLAAAGRKTRFLDGMRVTDRPTMRIVNRALEEVNRRLVTQIEALNGHAEGIVAEESKRRHWGEEELARRAKGDAQKVAVAVRLRAETAVTVKWIADRLHRGAPGYVNHLLYRQRKAKGK
jgi:hypothetical protein